MKSVTQPAKPVEMIDNRFVVIFEAEEEDIDPKEHFLRCGGTKAEYAKQRNAEWFCAYISLWEKGIKMAENWLGCCAYKNPDEFWTTYKEDYYRDMVKECLEAINIKSA